MTAKKEKEENEKFSFSGTFQKAREYVDTRFRIFQLKLAARSSRLIAGLMVDIVKVIFFLFVLFFFSLALGFYLSELLNSNALGFLCTGGIFIVLIGLVFAVEKPLERFLMNQSIQKFIQKWYDEDDEDEEGKQDQ